MLDEIREVLVDLKASVDVGHTDPAYRTITIKVTPKYAEWLKSRRGRDVDGFTSRDGGECSGKWALEEYIMHSLSLVENMIEKGVPKHIALGFLPMELHKLLSLDHFVQGGLRYS